MIVFELLAVFFLITIFLYFISDFLKRRKFYKLAEILPGHKISTFQAFRLFLLSTPQNVVQNFAKVLQNDSKLTKTWFLGYFIVLTKNPDLINKFLNSPQTYDKVDDLNKKAFLQYGLINLNGEKHKRHRKIFNKAFETKSLQLLPDIFDAKSKLILSEIEKNVDRGEFDVHDYIGAYALDSFSQSNLNYEFKHLQSDIFGVYKR
jgi:cytochrome P450